MLKFRVNQIAILLAFSTLMAALLGGPAPALAAEKPLNFVIILVDDMGWMDLSCQGSKYYETPNIDKLAKQGMRFTDAYAACAVCSPTRAAVQTGRYPGRIGVTDWIRARFQRGGRGTPKANPTAYVGGNRKLLCPPNPYWMEHEEVTIAEALKEKGYVSCHIGKWHLGDDAWFPPGQGYDQNFGGCDYGQPPSYFDPYTSGRLKQGIPSLKPRKKDEYLTDREGDEAANFIMQNKDRPFFLNMDHYAVHTPIQARADLTKKYEAKPKTNQKSAKYAAMVHSVDDAAGKIMAAIDKAGVADRTVIIFTSDNGGLQGPTNNAPLRSGKGYAYEGGIRVPLIIRWPGVAKPGTLSAEPVTSVDYFPTILEAAGVDLPKGREIDGKSLIAHLKSDGKKALDRDAIYWHFPHYRHNPGPYSIIRAGDLKLIRFWAGPTFELFNLKDDLSEKNNLATKMPDKVKELDAKLLAHLKAVGAKLPKVNPKYKAPKPKVKKPKARK
jgi:arylsulfatase A